MATVRSVVSDTAGTDVATGPTCGHPTEVGIEKDIGPSIARQPNGEPFHCRILGRESCGDTGALKWKILLEQALVDLGIRSMGGKS